MRKYSVDEIEQMRTAIRNSRWWWEASDAVTVEALLKTYMTNGTEPDELTAWSAEKAKEIRAAMGRDVDRQWSWSSKMLGSPS